MANKPASVQDTLSCIKEKIAYGQEYFTLFGRPVDTLPDASSSYEGYYRDSDDGFSQFLQFRLQMLSLYSIYQSLGAMTDDVKKMFLKLDEMSCSCDDDEYYDSDEFLELGYRLCYVASPFWKVAAANGWSLFDKDEYARVKEACDNGDEDEEEVDETLGELRENAIDGIVDAFRTFECNESVLSAIKNSIEVSDAMDIDLYCSYEIESVFLCVYSVLLEQFSKFYNCLSVVEQRKLKRRKLVKEFFSFLEDAGYYSCPSDMQCIAPIAVTDGAFISAVGDMNGQVGSALTPLCINYRAGLYGNIIDLYIFALDEEFHFLSDEYKGRSNEIFPDYIYTGKRGIKTA